MSLQLWGTTRYNGGWEYKHGGPPWVASLKVERAVEARQVEVRVLGFPRPYRLMADRHPLKV